jgi:hypothetical protein
MAPSLLHRRRIRHRNLALFTVAMGATAAAIYYTSNFVKTPQHTSKLRGQAWMEELLEGHHARIKDNLGATKEGFQYIEELLIRKGGLCQSRYMTTAEQLGIFLYAVVSDLPIRKLCERFQRSKETIGRVFHKVMQCFLSKGVYDFAIQPLQEGAPIANTIQYNYTYFPWFKDCVGAVDGTHIPVSPPAAARAAFRDHHGRLTQNVLAVCSFDMKFTNALVGWEGSTSDSTLWVQAFRCGAIQIPEGKYVLGDAGFPNCDLCLTPYRSIRYHLKEWEKAGLRPRNKEELYNLRHSKLRNVIERIFGVTKTRFRILTRPRAFAMKAQVRVVSALFVLHNILVNIWEAGEDEDNDQEEYEEDGEALDDGERTGQGYHITRGETTRAGAKRDAIAEAMWEDYCTRRGANVE